MQHGNIPALGYRIGDAAYTPDVSDIPPRAGRTWKISISGSSTGCAMPAHPSHFSVNDALSWIDRFKPRRAVITNMHSDLDYEVLRQSLPPDVIPAYDGMRLTVEQLAEGAASRSRRRRNPASLRRLGFIPLRQTKYFR